MHKVLIKNQTDGHATKAEETPGAIMRHSEPAGHFCSQQKNEAPREEV